ncbi:SMI1/KNR4 family protein [Niallia nealsonii]|uniref:SMI1/KNR4 family protein n=1 Tax=Niallia nealsonii TaxID=115979 RepID=A0A2N0Z054_9BACI|nr:SMI1/KNR4 family protein [Niallia nealsonii]PKG22890.1 SMI1/KNR4 family protein [Niallia nealsonii]
MTREIWEKDHDYYKLPPLKTEDIKKAEQQFKVTLPDSYIHLLKEQNGGSILFNAFPAIQEDFFIEPYIEVDYIYGIGEINGILETDYYLQEWEMPKGLILFNGDGHTWLAFDYRNVAANPPIIYIDNESEQIIKIAEDFEEFLNGLYTAEEDYPLEGEREFNEWEYSKEEFEALLEENDVEKLHFAIKEISQGEKDEKWVSDQLLKLATHSEDIIRSEVANSVWNSYVHTFNKKMIQTFIDIFQQDKDADVRMYADMIIEKINYSFEDLTNNLHTYKYMHLMFSFGEHFYQINRVSQGWSLLNNQTDAVQVFNTVDELLAQATLDGKPLKEMWSYVKVI